MPKHMHIPSGARSSHNFARAPQANIQRSKFDRSHALKTTFNEGYLIPFYADEMLPGDTFNGQLHAFIRLATPTFPIMDNLYFETHYFFVPNRLLWTNWEAFNGAQVDPDPTFSTSYLVPQMVAPTGAGVGVATGDLADYFGIPIKVGDLPFNSLHFRAYNLIWNEWYRDQNMQDSVVVDLDDGPDTYTDYVLLRRGKRHDYFTSCLPWPQKGPDVELPLGTFAPVVGQLTGTGAGSDTPIFRSVNVPTEIGAYFTGIGVNPNVQFANTTTTSSNMEWSSTRLVTDLSTATAATINELREAFQIQKIYERDARGGTRYQELIHAHFNVLGGDARLMRPEYCGGGSSPFQINPVAQTSPTSGSNALGDLAAYGVCAPQAHGFTYSSVEHGVIIGLMSVRADITYQQGLNRMWSRQERFDFFWPALSHIGEQAVTQVEIWAAGFPTTSDAVFGYQERYAEYRYKPSLVTGLFRSDATSTLDAWHLAQDFATAPSLGNDFIVENAPMSRIKAVSSEPDFLFDGFMKLICARPMSVYAQPGLIDHF